MKIRGLSIVFLTLAFGLSACNKQEEAAPAADAPAAEAPAAEAPAPMEGDGSAAPAEQPAAPAEEAPAQ
ncbi:MAG TPA: hypothetical protein VFX02_02055 [Gammaproteobacteria bacterium]|nr:hypothetical protein [Gammaproteobacteria bacterium]